MKTCFKCGAAKDLRQFYKHPRMADGHLNKCKSCTKNDVSANYQSNVDHYVEYDRQRAMTKKRKVALKLYTGNRRILRPGRMRATYAVSNALRDGRLIRLPCEVCGEHAEAHHDDYRRPLVVRWLCRKHHLEHHGKKKR